MNPSRTHRVVVTRNPSAKTVERVSVMLAIAGLTVAGHLATARRSYIPEQVSREAEAIAKRLHLTLAEKRATTEAEARMIAEAVRLAGGCAVVEYDPDLDDRANVVTVRHAALSSDAYRDCRAAAVDLAVQEVVRAANADPLARVDNFLAIGGFAGIARRAVDAACAAHRNGQSNLGSKIMPITVREVLHEPPQIAAIIDEIHARMMGWA